MKTKFFKKLSLVLVVAMVLSLFVPAAGVFAASKPSLNSDNKYLHLSGNPGPNEYNFNIKNKKKGWSYQWESKDESIAVVNEKNGVTTAKAVGKTTVYVVITDKDGEEVDTLEAKVTVRDNIKEVSVKNPVEKLAVGEAHDYNRSFVTESGSTKKTDSITRWTVEPSETAEIDDKGVFVATAGGEYTITARSFQSKARHKSWKADPEKYADYVLASDTTKVVVSANIVEVKQINKTKFTVEFDSSMADTDLSKDTAMVYQIINGKQYNTGTEKIKSLELDATGKIATVEIYGNILSKIEYQFVYGDLKDGFTAANNDLSEIDRIVFDDFTVVTGKYTDMRDKVNAVNKDNVVILTGKDISDYLQFSYDGDYAYGWNDGYNAYINKNGYNGKFIVKYNNYLYNEVTKVYEAIELQDDAIGTGVETSLMNTTMQFAVIKDTDVKRDNGNVVAPDNWEAKWFNEGFKVPEGDNYFIFARYKNNTDAPDKDYTRDTDAGSLVYDYVSTDTDKMVIIGRELFAIKQGIVTVLVKNTDGNVVGAFDIQILPSRGYTTSVPNKSVASIGNKIFENAIDIETDRITLKHTDTMGSPVDFSVSGRDITAVVDSAPKNSAGDTGDITVNLTFGSGNQVGETYVDVTPKANSYPGTYRVKVTSKAGGDYGWQERVNILTVEVKDSSDPTVKNWRLEFVGGNSIDLVKQKAEKVLTVKVYGYNVKGARVAVVAPTDYDLTVMRGSWGIAEPAKARINDSEILLAYTTDSATGTALKFVDLGSYSVTAKANADNVAGRTAGSVIDIKTFTVSDSVAKTVVRQKTSVSAGALEAAGKTKDVYNAIKDSFKLELDYGNVWNDGDATVTFKYTMGTQPYDQNDGSEELVVGKSINVQKIYVTKSWADDKNTNKVTYEYDVNRTITISR